MLRECLDYGGDEPRCASAQSQAIPVAHSDRSNGMYFCSVKVSIYEEDERRWIRTAVLLHLNHIAVYRVT